MLIFIHECGHFFTGQILGFKVKRIEIYPYGGCSKLEYDINVPLWKEFLVLIMGPLLQIIFVSIIYSFKLEIEASFYTYHLFILMFNLLPIYPLDGGKLLNIILCYITAYYQSLRKVFYFSFFFYLIISLSVLFWQRNLVLFLILGLLGLKIHKEINRAEYYYQKFLMERYLNNYSFSKIKKITNIKQMKRDYYHYFLNQGNMITETEKLSAYFS